jgi:excisionase family DNA binding protein
VTAPALTLRPEEAAKLLRVGREQMYELIRKGEVPSIKTGRRFLIPKKALEEWLETRAAEEQERRRAAAGISEGGR